MDGAARILNAIPPQESSIARGWKMPQFDMKNSRIKNENRTVFLKGPVPDPISAIYSVTYTTLFLSILIGSDRSRDVIIALW